MPSPNVIAIPPDLSELVADREKVWAEVERSQSLSAELGKLSAQVPQCAPAPLQLQFGPDSTPPAELAAVLPLLKEKIETASKLSTNVKACHDEIEAIKHREKMIIVAVAVAAVVLLIVLLIVAVNLLSGS
jgi:hypothetical protein